MEQLPHSVFKPYEIRKPWQIRCLNNKMLKKYYWVDSVWCTDKINKN